MWSTPSLSNNFDNKYDIKYLTKNFYTYLLSALLVRKMGYRIELFCDERAYEIYSTIPYHDIHLVNFDLDGISSKFWIWGKIKTQSLINEPYVHIDGDVLFFKDIIKDSLIGGKYKAVVQSVENERTIGIQPFQDLYIKSRNPFLTIDSGIDWQKYGLQAYNCGVVGFSDMKLKNEYVNTVKKILCEISSSGNFNEYRQKYEGMFLIAEQSVLYYILHERNINPFEIFPYGEIINHMYSNGNWYSTLPIEKGYCHLLGYSKYKKTVVDGIKQKILTKFPEYFSIVDDFEKKWLKSEEP